MTDTSIVLLALPEKIAKKHEGEVELKVKKGGIGLECEWTCKKGHKWKSLDFETTRKEWCPSCEPVKKNRRSKQMRVKATYINKARAAFAIYFEKQFHSMTPEGFGSLMLHGYCPEEHIAFMIQPTYIPNPDPNLEKRRQLCTSKAITLYEFSYDKGENPESFFRKVYDKLTE